MHIQYNNSNNSNNSSNDTYASQEIRRIFKVETIIAAENKLNSMSNRNAEWNFLMGACHLRKGWFDSGLQYVQTCCKYGS